MGGHELGDPYHFGMVVEDIEQGLAQVGAALGLSWTELTEREMTLRTAEGTIRPRLRFAYSTTGTPHIELLEAVTGTPWEAGGPGGWHHAGYWSEDLAADSARLAEQGAPRVVTYDSDREGPVGFAYHRLPTGQLVELVDASRREGFEAWFAGGEFADAG